MDDVIPIRKPEILLEVGGPVDESRVVLAIYGDELDPDEVSRRLGCAPTHSHRKGDPTRSAGIYHKSGAWLLTVEGKAPEGPDQLATRLLGPFPQDEEFWRALCRDYRVQVRVGIHTDGWNREFRFEPATVALLARTGAQINFDLYFYGEGDER
jgi:Domain of unknown function (DUF4279)